MIPGHEEHKPSVANITQHVTNTPFTTNGSIREGRRAQFNEMMAAFNGFTQKFALDSVRHRTLMKVKFLLEKTRPTED